MAELRAAEEDRRSVHQTVLLAVESYLALRETAEIKADPDALRALAEAREAIREGDVVYGTEAVRALLRGRRASWGPTSWGPRPRPGGPWPSDSRPSSPPRLRSSSLVRSFATRTG
ncbi:MAG: hypothetical protein ACRDPK_04370 [Carbonactinosporaceae bacterium]